MEDNTKPNPCKDCGQRCDEDICDCTDDCISGKLKSVRDLDRVLDRRFSRDDIWEAAGAFGYTDDIADGMEARMKEFPNVSGMMVSKMELAWLIEGYRRLRDNRR